MNRNPSRVLMVTPDHYRIDYAINPFMTDAAGRLKEVEASTAMKQWHDLKSAYENLGIEVQTLDGDPQLPDMVFAANQSFVYLDQKDGSKNALLSKMRYNHRQMEVQHFREWFERNNYKTHEIPEDFDIYGFEGNGDALYIAERNLIIGGSGPRTSPVAYDYIKELTNLDVIMLEPTERLFYHLDTCLSVLDNQTVALVEGVFSKKEVGLLKEYFETILTIPREEAEYGFAGNCHCPDGKNVLLQKGNVKFCQLLMDHGFHPVEVNTSEFIKSGGSVFCLKMSIF